MLKYFFISLMWFCYPSINMAQLYTDASVNLPDNGTRGTSMDIQAADLDGDGDLDIVLANEFQANTILLNDGDGVFTNWTAGNLPQVVNDSEDVTIADFNSDGALDLVFCSEDDVMLSETNVHEYYLGEGNGAFANAFANLPDSEANAVISADLNGDGAVDLLFGNNGSNSLLLNDGNGVFTRVSDCLPAINKTTQDLALADVDGDGDLDLMEGNENGNLLLINDGNGCFTDETATRLPTGLNVETRKVTFGDVDGDGDLDMFWCNVNFIPTRNPQNRLLLNDGSGVFTDVTNVQLPTDNHISLDAVFEDVDFDGDFDLVIANAFNAPIKLYQNDGNGVFTDETEAVFETPYFRDALGLITADFNGDGLRDLYVCDRNNPPGSPRKDILLLRNPITTFTDSPHTPSAYFTLFPNPGRDYLMLQFDKALPRAIVISDSTGRQVQTIDAIQSTSVQLELTQVPKGSYTVLVRYADGREASKQWVKE